MKKKVIRFFAVVMMICIYLATVNIGQNFSIFRDSLLSPTSKTDRMHPLSCRSYRQISFAFISL